MGTASSGREPTEFRFQGRPRAEGAVWVLFVAALFLLGSLVTGAWGIAALFHASWLDSGDLPAAGPTAWGIGMLLLATVQGICGLLILFGRRLGYLVAIGIAMLGILGHLAVIAAYPLWSVAGVAVYVLVIGILVAYRPR